MTDTTTSTEDINPTILSSDDLMDLRKPCDVPMPESVCKKFYIPDESDKNHVASLLKDQKRMLDEKVVSRVADLIQAEWKPDLKKAVTTKLKGKRQHVGIAVDGKVFLSPEETIFLLENGNLELLLNDVPLSTESAYAQILSDDLALEKYQVYSHLSRLGYIVVQHQKDADLVRNEKLHAMNKCQCAKRKRKHHEANTSSKKVCLPNGISPECRSVSPSQQLPSAEVTLEPPSGESSRLEQSEKTLNETSELETEKHKETICSVEGVSALNSDSISQEQCTLTGVTTVNSSIKDNEGLKADVVSSTDDTERESTGVSPLENLKTQSVPKSTPHPEENTTELSKVNHTSEATNSNAVEEVTTAVSSKSDATVSPNHSAVINEANTIHSDQTTQNNKETELSVTSEKNDDYSQDAVISVEEDVSLTCSENGNSHIEPQSSNSMDSREITDSGDKTGMKNAIVVDDDGPDPDGSGRITTNGTKARVNVFRIDDDLLDESTSSDSDILCVDESDHDSESSDSCEETNDDSIQSLSETDDVMIVEVNKGRAEPLEVIDLSSDDENKNEPEKDATDDDDILFIEECPRSNSTTGRMQEWLPTGLGSKLKKEGGKKAFFKMERSSHDPDAFSFPNLFRKRVVCLPRPPAHLLPFNVHMNKEAYTIDLSMLTGPNIHRPVQRVWNSYKDLQQRMYNFKNEAGLACNYPKGFHSNSPQQNAHFGPYSSGPSLNHHSTPFQNNLLSQNNRLDSPNMDHGFSSHTVQSTAFHSNPMPGAMLPNHRFPMGPTQPSMNPRGSPLLTGSPHLHNSHRRDFLNVTENSKQNTGCQPPNPWTSLEEPLDDHRSFPNSFQSSGHCDEASFTSSPSPWQNNRRNDEAIRSSTGVWMNPPMNTGFESSPNLRPNMPGNEESFRVGSNPWMNSPQNQGYGSSPNSCILSRGPPDFQHNTPFQDPYGSFSTPYMSNWRPLLLQNDAFYGNRQGFQPSPMDMRGRNFWDNPYPCDIPKSSARTSSWRDFKSSAHLDTDKDAEEGKDDDSEVQEVPIDIDEVLWSKEISPLVRPGTNMSLSEVVKALQITTQANVSTAACYNERLLPDVCSLKVSFDVYMPGTAYKKTCPTVPNHRIIVTRSTDPFPKLSDIVILQRRFKDNAFLQFAVVNNGNFGFLSQHQGNIMSSEKGQKIDKSIIWAPPYDPRFPNTNQTRNCYQNYLDYHRCHKVKGEDYEPCNYFQKVYRSLCPNSWVENWDTQIEEGRFPGNI